MNLEKLEEEIEDLEEQLEESLRESIMAKRGLSKGTRSARDRKRKKRGEDDDEEEDDDDGGMIDLAKKGKVTQGGRLMVSEQRSCRGCVCGGTCGLH